MDATNVTHSEIESFWSMFKHTYVGTYHYMSDKHLQRYINEFSGRQRVRENDTAHQLSGVVATWTGKRLLFRDLITS